MRRLLPFLALLALVGAPHAAAAPGLLVGVDDDSLEWYGHTQSLLSIYDSLGLGAVRVTVGYPPDPQERTELQRINQASRRTRVIIAVTGAASSPPLDDASRGAYCAYVASLLRRLPLVHDVAIWTEPNSTTFWRPGTGAAAAYEALLATCYDAIHAAQPQANVIATSAPHARPGDWYTALGRAYRASGRTQPIFDTIGHNAYPQSSSESPAAHHRHSIDEGDVARLTAVLKKSFGTVPPIWYLEDGFQTAESSSLYSGSETDRNPVTEEQQAAQLTKAVQLAYCEPGITGFFNFELRDDASLAGWQSGVLRPDWSAKPAFVAFLQAIQAVRAGTIDCGQPAR